MNEAFARVLSDSLKLLIAAATLMAVAGQLSAQEPASQPWQPGKEFRVSDPAAGTDGYFLAYVPTDYNEFEKWPVVFYYHGLGGRPDTGVIRRIANGKYCIVVGMSYYAPGMEGYRFLETEDVRILRHVLAKLKERLNVNDRKLYIAGFSKGGFYTCEMLRLLSPELAGAVVLGAGSKSLDAKWPDLTGKEVFVGCGQEDGFIGTAKATQKHLSALGAMVTFEQWPGIGHSVGDVAGLRKWLFEQTADRPHGDIAQGDIDAPPAPGTPSPVSQEYPKPRSVAWAAGVAITAGFVAASVMLVRWRRRGRLRTSAQVRSENEES